MFRQLSSLIGRKAAITWYLVDCANDPPVVRRVEAGDVVPIGGDGDWSLDCGTDHALVSSGDGGGSINFNGGWVGTGGPHKLLAGGEYCLVVPTGREARPYLLFGGSPEPAWAENESPPLYVKQRGDRWDGPFRTLADLRSRLVRGQVPDEALLGVESASVFFNVKDLWPELIEPAAVAPPPKLVEDDSTVIEGKLVCPFCRCGFGLGHILYFSPPDSPGKNDPPSLPASWDLRSDPSVPMDKHGKVCVDRACPICKQRLPRSFGVHPYTIFSLVGQSGSGKSYYLAALFHELPSVLDRFGLGYLGDDAELNREFESLSQIPFKSGPVAGRFIKKTDNLAGTQIEVLLRGEDKPRFVPKPIVFRVGKGRSDRRYVTFYDNPGEHFTTVDLKSKQSEQARVAASHIAFASTVFVLYDPTLSVEFCNALKMEAPGGEGDQQVTMLNALPERLRNERIAEGGDADRDVPLAVLVGKWDLWKNLAPGLSRDYLTADNRLDLGVVRGNSAILRNLLNDKRTGVPSAVAAISSEVVFFPVSSFGEVKPEKFTEGGAVFYAPSAPVKPWSVDIPFLWAMWRNHPDLVPTVSDTSVTSSES